MGKSPFYLLLIGLFFGSLYVLKTYQKNFVPTSLTEEVKKPDIYLDNSRLYVKEHSYDRSVKQLRMAISAMREIKGDLDEESNKLIDESITDLETVLAEFDNYEVNIEDMNEAFSKALNVLTLAELRVSEVLIENEESNEAKVALKYGMYHIKNALQYTQGNKKAYEAHIYDEIDSLLDSEGVPKAKLIEKLEYMIGELDSLVHGQVK